MSQEAPRQWGITKPISTKPPTEKEEALSNDLLKTLQEHGLFESEQEAQTRMVVLGKLNALAKDFVFAVSKSKGFPDSIAKEAGGKIFTFGSYRLGVHGAGADIDTLCVFPKHVEREQFFEVMLAMLKERPEVTDLTAIEDAYVPVINMHFSGIPIDFVCARLALARVPEDLELSDNNLLRNVDERCVRSLNGSRVTDEILRLVPNIPAFRIALRTIKLWAKRRAIYSNVMGFLGGVAWAMLMARICQLYPNACAASLVNRFFHIMSQWKWPQPVLLKELEEGPLQVRVWNPKLYPADRNHKMPIITPAYPSMCATHNVTDSTRTIMIKEFKLAFDITEKIMTGKGKWDDLFGKSDFFLVYKHYLQITASSNSADTQLKWHGLVESKLRQLVSKLDFVEMVILAHPYYKGIDKVQYCLTEQEKEDVTKGIFVPERTFDITEGTMEENHIGKIKESLNLTEEQVAKIETVYATTFYIGLSIEKKTDEAAGARKLDIAWPIQEFVKVVKGGPTYDESIMFINVANVKGSNLPTELTGGEKRTKRTLKNKEGKNGQTKKKRKIEGQGDTSAVSTPEAAVGTPATVDTDIPMASEASEAVKAE